MTNPLLLAPRWTRIATATFVAGLVPLCFLGAGTDLDAGAVLHSGERIVHGSYVASRAPGSPVHEAAAGVLDALAGVWAVNLLSLVAAVAVCAGVWWLLRREGVASPWLAAAFVAAGPWFQVAATSTVDFVVAAALVVAAAVALRRGSPTVAGVLAGLAVGTRMSMVLLVAAIVIAEATGATRDRSRALRVTVAAGVVGVLAFVPPYVAAGWSLSFAQNDFSSGSPPAHVGRALVKNLAYLGPLAAVVLVFAVPALWRLRHRWHDSWVVRFAAVGFVLTEALFVRFPWKVGHLIPTMACFALLLGEALRDRPRLFGAIVLAQLSLGVVNVELFAPDVPNAAVHASVDPRIRPGPLVVDVQCRLEDRGAARSLDLDRRDAVWNCARPFGTGR